MNIQQAAKALGGDVVGRASINCPGPGHSAHDRSLRVTFNDSTPTVYSHAGDDWKLCKDHVRQRLGSGIVDVPAFSPDDDKRRTERALAIWHASLSLTGTPAEAYLANRCLIYSGAALRWHPFCPFDKGFTTGCMVSLVRNIITNEPQAIHRTAIDWHGRKQAHLGTNGRKALGPIKGGAIKLFDATDVLGIGEGIETALSVRLLHDAGNVPVWSMLNAAGIGSIPALPGIKSVFIAIDNDRSETGEKSAEAARKNLASSNIKTYSIRTQKVGTDLNDFIMERAGRNV